jgi:hypothetical protein
MGVARLGFGVISADRGRRLFMVHRSQEDMMKKHRHSPKPKRVRRKKGIVSRVIIGSTKAVSKAWK